MMETKTERIAPEVEQEAGPSKASEFLGKVAPIALGAAIIGGIAVIGFKLDGYINDDLVSILRENWSWVRVLGSKHALTALFEMHPVMVTSAFAAIGAFGGATVDARSKTPLRDVLEVFT